MEKGSGSEASFVSTTLLRVHGLLAEVGRTHDLDGVLDVIARSALTLLGASAVSISRLDGEQGTLRTLRNVGELAPWEETHPENELYSAVDYAPLLRLMARPRPWRICIDDLDADPAEVEILRLQGKVCGLGIPVMLRRQVWGEIYATRTTSFPFSADDAALGQLIGAAFALGIDRVTGHEELLRLAYVDPLTGLANRRRADEVMDQALDEGREIVVALFDVDGMKTVNDREGHAAGDRLLARVGISLSEAASALPGTIAARLGGDEFALVAVGVDRTKFADEVARVVEAAAALAPGAGLSAGISDGRAVVLERADTKAVYRRADAALYRAKRAGGSQLVQARSHADPHAPATPEAERVRERPVVTSGGVSRMVVGDALERVRLDTLIELAVRVTDQIDASSWWISMAPAGSGHLVTTAFGIDRTPSSGATTSMVGSVYRLSDFPETQRVCEGGTSIVRLHDPTIEQSEADFLAELGYTANLMAGATDAEGRRWLVEIFTDVLSDEPASAVDRLRAGVLAAVRTSGG